MSISRRGGEEELFHFAYGASHIIRLSINFEQKRWLQKKNNIPGLSDNKIELWLSVIREEPI